MTEIPTTTLDLELRPMLQRITDAVAAKFDCEFVALVINEAPLSTKSRGTGRNVPRW